MSRWTIIEDSGFSILGRLHADGVLVTQAGLASITYSVFQCHTDTVVVAVSSLVIATVIFDTLQTNALLWTEDATGYNFKHDVASTVITDSAYRYEFEYVITPVSGSPFIWMPDKPLTVRSVKTS